MGIKNAVTITAMLAVVLMGSCQKEQITNLSSEELPEAKSSSFQSQSVTFDGVNLGVAGNFAILSKTGITDVYRSDVTGDVGTSPITGAALLLSCSEVTGTVYTVDAAGPACKVTSASMLTTAIGDMQTAYTDAAGRSNPDFLNLGAGDIGGQTLIPGLYKWTSALLIPTDIAINGGPNDIWIFQIDGTLNMSSGVNITLAGGAQAENKQFHLFRKLQQNYLSI